jgi:hypothetical protein
VGLQPVIRATFIIFINATPTSLFSFVPAHVLSLIRSAAFIAFGALLTCFVCR